MSSVPVLRVHELSFRYPGGRPALESISFQVGAGESVGLVGPNGAGKTTLFLCLCGILKVAPGTIELHGLDPAIADQRRQLPKHVGVVFQDSDDQLISPTVFDDVAFGPLNLGLSAEEVKARAAEAIKGVGLSGLESRVPHHLSGGEKRRAALAGVLAMRPELILFDEPTIFLDPRGRRELGRIINDLTATKLIAAHDLAFVSRTCQRVIVIDGGKVVADGPVVDVLGNHDLMERHGLEVVV